MKANVPREFTLTVAEIDDMLVTLNAAKAVNDLTGDRRRQMTELCYELSIIRGNAINGETVMPTSIAVKLLRYTMNSQRWLSETIADLLLAKTND